VILLVDQHIRQMRLLLQIMVDTHMNVLVIVFVHFHLDEIVHSGHNLCTLLDGLEMIELRVRALFDLRTQFIEHFLRRLRRVLRRRCTAAFHNLWVVVMVGHDNRMNSNNNMLLLLLFHLFVIGHSLCLHSRDAVL